VDDPRSAKHLERLRERYPHEVMVPVSASTELWLCQKRREGAVTYLDGDCAAAVVADTEGGKACKSDHTQQLEAMRRDVLDIYGSTGVLRALSEACRMRRSIFCFPVGNLETLVGLESCSKGSTGVDSLLDLAALRGSALPDCIMLKRGASVEDLYNVLRHQPYRMLAGDYIRAEGRGADGSPTRVLKKDELITPACCIIKLMTNKKVNWQSAKNSKPTGHHYLIH
ncbi:hypothetical protein CYMTET_19816, partial [Cymbomonas tetramitiformis]